HLCRFAAGGRGTADHAAPVRPVVRQPAGHLGRPRVHLAPADSRSRRRRLACSRRAERCRLDTCQAASNAVEKYGPEGEERVIVATVAVRRDSWRRTAWEDFVAVRRFLPLVRALVASSLRTENVGTVLGYVWWLLHPLMQMAAYVVLLDVMLNAG